MLPFLSYRGQEEDKNPPGFLDVFLAVPSNGCLDFMIPPIIDLLPPRRFDGHGALLRENGKRRGRTVQTFADFSSFRASAMSFLRFPICDKCASIIHRLKALVNLTFCPQKNTECEKGYSKRGFLNRTGRQENSLAITGNDRYNTETHSERRRKRAPQSSRACVLIPSAPLRNAVFPARNLNVQISVCRGADSWRNIIRETLSGLRPIPAYRAP